MSLKMLKIVHVCPFYYPSIGGIEVFCRELATRTASLGHEVHVITQVMHGFPGYYHDGKVKIHRLRPLLKLYKGVFIPHVAKKIGEIDPDIIHIQAPAPGMAEFAALDGGARILMTYHNDPKLSNDWLYVISVEAYRRLIFPRIISNVDKMVVLAKSSKEMSPFLRGVPDSKISLIPNGVDVDRFSPGDRSRGWYKELVDVDSEYVVLFVGSMGRWHAYKGVRYLIDSIRYLDDLHVMFVFVGEGDLKEQYYAYAKSIGLSSKTKFVGKVDDDELPDYYRACDVFVLPSTSVENCPLVLLEAFACGLPAITTRIAGPMELVEEGVNGYTVPPRDSRSFAKAIRLILLNNDERNKMGRNARRLAIEKYSWRVILEKYMQEYSLL